MQIFLIRHGETTANIGENYVSRVPDHLVSLTEKGIAQSNKAGKWLADYCVQNNIYLNNACIWRSPYMRTRQTSEEFNKHLNIGSVREDVTLTELQFGLFDALPEEEWEHNFPVEYAECKRYWDTAGKFYLRFPNGESPFDVSLRVHQFMGTIKRDEKYPLFIFTHGITIRCFLLRWFHYTPEWYAGEKNPNNCWIRLIDGNRDAGYIYSA
ncbi:MAG: histidine phosphatase family protein [Oscillospiraceae bacterium]|nr:histidine phosphatase family protein [Oscillospiraceae bacterium]